MQKCGAAGKAIEGQLGEYTVASKFAYKVTEDGSIAIDGNPKFIRSPFPCSPCHIP